MQNLDHNHRDIVAPTIVVGHLDQLRGRKIKIDGEHLQGIMNFHIFDQVVETIGT